MCWRIRRCLRRRCDALSPWKTIQWSSTYNREMLYTYTYIYHLHTYNIQDIELHIQSRTPLLYVPYTTPCCISLTLHRHQHPPPSGEEHNTDAITHAAKQSNYKSPTRHNNTKNLMYL